MRKDYLEISKAFAPRFINKAIDKFDKASAIIVSVCWGSALLIMLAAIYTVNLSVDAKKNTIEAMAMQPSLPKMKKRQPRMREMEPIVERLQRRFPKILFNLGRDLSLTVSTTDGGMFRNWLTILSYIDTISPQYSWEIKDLCVGMRCPGSVPMKAILVPKKITFVPAPTPVKE